MLRYMDEWDDEYEEELEKARREAEENGEEFDEDEWREERHALPDEDARDDDFSETDPEDPWNEDDHRQRARKGGGGHNSNSGLRQAEQNAGDFYNYAHMAPEDGHGISVPQLTAFEKDDAEKVFRKPESPEERNANKMERIAQKYERNENPWEEDGSGTGFFEEEHTRFDEWVDEHILSSAEERKERKEAEANEAQDMLTNYEDDIIERAEERVIDYFADGEAEDRNIKRLRDDVSYVGSADREYYQLHQELKHKLEMYEDRMADDPHDNTYYLPHVLGAMEAINDANYLYAQNRKRKEELREMHESEELSNMRYVDQSFALDARLRRQLTNNQYKAISGGKSMFEDVGEIMDQWNNLLDDILSDDIDQLQEARDFLGQFPYEAAEKLIHDAVSDGFINRTQANHLMTMAVRPA